jgi:multidrug efflux pump subunit AcrB
MYTPMLRWALRHRAAVLFLALIVFAGGIATAFFLPVSFFPPSEERLAIARIELPAGMGLDRTDREVRPFEDFLLDDGGWRVTRSHWAERTTSTRTHPSVRTTRPRRSSPSPRTPTPAPFWTA